MQIFGFEIKRKQETELPSVVAPASDDGSTVINSAAAYYGMVVDLEGIIKTENDLIRRYREIAQYPDCDSAIEDIVNEAIVVEEDVEIAIAELLVDQPPQPVFGNRKLRRQRSDGDVVMAIDALARHQPAFHVPDVHIEINIKHIPSS